MGKNPLSSFGRVPLRRHMTEIIRCASDYNLLLSNFNEIYLSHFDQPAPDCIICIICLFLRRQNFVLLQHINLSENDNFDITIVF